MLITGCKQQPSPLSVNDDEESGAGEILAPDLADIEQSGELIAVTINGPDTYYEYRNRSMGLQFMLAEGQRREPGRSGANQTVKYFEGAA